MNTLLLGLDGPANGNLPFAHMNPRDLFAFHVTSALDELKNNGSTNSPIPLEILDKIQKGTLRIAGTAQYGLRETSTNMEMFKTADSEQVGITSLDKGKFKKDQIFLLTGIQVLVGTAVDATAAARLAIDFDSIDSATGFRELVNGEFKLVVDGKIIIPETSMTVFATENKTNILDGYYELSAPRIIVDDKRVELTIEPSGVSAIPANSYVKVVLHGMVTIPA